MNSFSKDKTRVVVYGFILFLILFLMFAWFTRKPFTLGHWLGKCDVEKGCMIYETKCECVGTIRGKRYYGDPSTCFGIILNCHDSSYWGLLPAGS